MTNTVSVLLVKPNGVIRTRYTTIEENISLQIQEDEVAYVVPRDFGLVDSSVLLMLDGKLVRKEGVTNTYIQHENETLELFIPPQPTNVIT